MRWANEKQVGLFELFPSSIRGWKELNVMPPKKGQKKDSKDSTTKEETEPKKEVDPEKKKGGSKKKGDDQDDY